MSSDILTPAEAPRLFSKLWVRFSEGPSASDAEKDRVYPSPYTLAGFEDVIPEGLGTGRFFNHPTSTELLRMALAISPNRARVEEIVDGTGGSGTRHLMTTLRAEQVLAGMRLVDLGAGIKPGFALAAETMGAEVHTVDVNDLDQEIKDQLASHTIADLSKPTEALEKIQKNTGNELDYVSTNIIGNVPGFERLAIPQDSVLKSYGEQLLRTGGYFYDNTALLQKV